jgi:hypothetical protein
MKIENIIKELNNICANIYEIHTLIICNKLNNLNDDIKYYITPELFSIYNKELENLYFESFFNECKYDKELSIVINEIIFLISEIIVILNKIILNYP